jgi:hypothetical protein
MCPIARHLESRRLAIGDLPFSPAVPARVAVSTWFERVLLFLTIVILPLQEDLPVIAGFSAIFFLFAFVGLYVLILRPRSLRRILRHPVFLASYAFLIVCGLIETFHPYPRYSELFRMIQTFLGALFLASLCRDRKALQAGIWGYLIMAVGISAFLFLTSYGVLQSSDATDFSEATRVRLEVQSESSLTANPNTLGFFAAQGTTISLALALTTISRFRRYVFYGTLMVCGIATFLPMSRGGVAIAVICCGSVLLAAGFKHIKILIAIVPLLVAVILLVPDAALSRLVFAPQSSAEGKVEGRTRVYTAAIELLPEYVWTGIGFGNFWGPWGLTTDFAKRGAVTGPHNAFIATIIYWGLPGLAALLFVILQAYRCLPRNTREDPQALCLFGIALSLVLFLMVMHVLSAKQFALGLGLLVGARCWIWPRKTKRSVHLSSQSPDRKEILLRSQRLPEATRYRP